MKAALALVLTFIMVGLLGCGKKDGAATVSGTASVVMGPSTASRALSERPVPNASSRTCTTPADGNWFLTPDMGHVTFKQVTFNTQDGNLITSALSSCTVTYDRTKASGSQLLQCPVAVPQGTIVKLSIYYSTSFDIQISDSTNCIFTNPTKTSGFSNTVPSGGPQFATFTVTAQSGDFVQDTYLATPFVVKAGDTPSLSITTDMIHTMFVTASGGNISFTGAQSPSPLVFIYADFSALGKSEFYTSSGTVGDINVGSQTAEGSVFRVAYLSTGEAAHLWTGAINGCVFGDFPTEAWNTAPSASAANPSNGFRAGGYLGLDPNQGANGTLAFALPVDFTYAAYRSLVTMPRLTTLGTSTTTTAKCRFLNGTAPAPTPTSGNTYASGAPAISPIDGQQNVSLLAK